jgi:hypothetical protein
MLKSVLEDAKPTAVITVKELADSLKGNNRRKKMFALRGEDIFTSHGLQLTLS